MMPASERASARAAAQAAEEQLRSDGKFREKLFRRFRSLVRQHFKQALHRFGAGAPLAAHVPSQADVFAHGEATWTVGEFALVMIRFQKVSQSQRKRRAPAASRRSSASAKPK